MDVLIRENRYIHICEDEKFINNANYLFEKSFPGNNIFFVIVKNKKNDLIHVKRKENVFIVTVEEILAKVNNYSGILFFHSLPDRFFVVLETLNNSNFKIFWLTFGFETYSNPLLYPTRVLYDKLTKSIQDIKQVSIKDSLFFRKLYRVIKKKLPLSRTEKRILLTQKIDFISSSGQKEFKFLCNIYHKDFKNFNFFYYPIEKIVDITYSDIPKTNTILIGNSASYSNNHLDVLEKIKMNKITNDLLLPLSYGDHNYRDKVIIDFKYKHKNTKFLTDFMSIDGYNKLISNCKFAIFNTRRQQAVGNITALLWFGVKVFMSKKNLFLDTLKSQGIIVFCYEDDFNEIQFRTGLSENEINYNRNILKKIYSEELIVSNIIETLKLV